LERESDQVFTGTAITNRITASNILIERFGKIFFQKVSIFGMGISNAVMRKHSQLDTLGKKASPEIKKNTVKIHSTACLAVFL